MIVRLTSFTPTQHPHTQTLRQFLADNPNINIAYIDPHAQTPTIIAYTTQPPPPDNKYQTRNRTTYNVQHRSAPQPRTLQLDLPAAYADTPYTACQNAPIKLGTQIQPYRQPWVGTAGGPVKFKTPDNKTHWGIITNAHVSGTPTTPIDANIHQPTDKKPPIGRTTIYAYPAPSIPNTLDVALIDTLTTDHHTTDWQIIGLGRPATTWTNAITGTPVTKCGRTTGITHGKVSATQAAARINYGHFVAQFDDLDVIQSESPFSAPGDSGSLILHAETSQPLSLLFAGGSGITLAIPIRNIANQTPISFNP